MRVHLTAVLVVSAFASALAGGRPGPGKGPGPGVAEYNARVNAARKALDAKQKNYARAEQLLAQILDDAAAPVRFKVAALHLRSRIARETGDAEQAKAILLQAEQMNGRERDRQHRMKGYRDQATLFLELGAVDESIRVGTQALALARRSISPAMQADCLALLRLAHDKKGQKKEADAFFEQLAGLVTGPEGRRDVRMAAARQLIRFAELGHAEEGFEIVAGVLRDFPTAPIGGALLQLGDRFRNTTGDLENALRCYRMGIVCVGTKYPEMKPVRECARRLSGVAFDQDDLPTALVHAKHFYLMVDVRDVQMAVEQIAKILKKQDGDINKRVRGFLEFQRYGPAGRDGQRGTADDLQDPIANIKAPELKPAAPLDKMLNATDALQCELRAYVYLQHGKPEHALMEALAAYRMATGESIADPVYCAATVLKAIDGDLVRANAYLLYQKHGPAGPDGKSGTTDDLKDPLAGVKLPAVAGRDKMLAEAVAACEEHELRRKGVLLLAWGKCDAGLEVMQEVYARCGVAPQPLKQVILGIAGALKALDGHVFRANQYLLYQKHGPAGPDGIPGNADDIVNPLDAGRKPAPKAPAPVPRPPVPKKTAPAKAAPRKAPVKKAG